MSWFGLLRRSLRLGSVILQALIFAILINWILGVPIRPAY
jgi:hypothetical protein